ncbi:MAG: hypothetical protein OXF31_07320 [Gammaproteobacteria bacterium]|nr:hypothetical protein [Gammaproteobacteria bacterium]
MPPPPRLLNYELGIIAAVLVAISFILPAEALAQKYQCQEQFDQDCIHAGWQYGRDEFQDSDTTFYMMDRTTALSKDALGKQKGWYVNNRSTFHNRGRFYPAYFDGRNVYVGARCRNGNMGTTYIWAKHPHADPPPDRRLPSQVNCP